MKVKKKKCCVVCSIKMSVKAKNVFIQLHLLNGPDQLTVSKGVGAEGVG